MGFASKSEGAIPIQLVPRLGYTKWLSAQSESVKAWLSAIQFKLEPGNACLVPNKNGSIEFALCCLDHANDAWSVGNLPILLPEGTYRFSMDDDYTALRTVVWGLGAYQYTRYKKPKKLTAKLYLPESLRKESVEVVKSLYLVRDLINTPTDDMGPSQLSEAARALAHEFSAQYHEIIGDDLLSENYPGIHTVGRASDDAPRLLDLRYGEPHHPKVTLVGKGVCFDSGGLDIKPGPSMLLMKKDMGGAAHVLGLARMIMAMKLPVRLRVLIPAVENAIAGNAYRPGDVIKSRKGLTIEVGNTDAEGRIVVADALAEAVLEKPDLLIDITTLTGAARIALGTELPALFSNNQALAQAVLEEGERLQDYMWQLPLFKPYREYNKSTIADLTNSGTEPYGGAITAALFLQEFVPKEIDWLHFDMMAWNLRSRPGKPQGAEAMGLRALFSYIKNAMADKKT